MIGDFSSEATPQINPLPAPATPKPLPIEGLIPKSDRHEKLLQYLLDRLNYSERTMSQFYSRWNASEKKLQAYINLPDYEKQLKEMSDKGAPPQVTDIIVPYSFATIWTIVTYLVHTFCGQKPIFQVSSYKSESVQAAEYMETILQYNADHTRLILAIIQWMLDAETYGVGAVRCLWNIEKAKRTVWQSGTPGGVLMPGQPQMMRTRVLKTTYEGNKVTSIDPFQFFPDPRVPMNECNRRGEFVFWRSYEGKFTLKKEEAQGNLKFIDDIAEMPRGNPGESSGKSMRSLLAKGDATAGDPMTKDSKATSFYQVDQGTIDIIPADFGFTEEDCNGEDPTQVQKWLFSIGNKMQIIQAEPFDSDHGRHPVSVIEPCSFGYAFGQPGTADFLGPIQDTLSWFVNSHIHNVRSALNNMFIVDPSMVEMQDLKNPGPGKIIRLKRSAYGQDVKMALQQLQVNDVTSGHMQSMELFLKIGDTLAAVNDNLRGIQDSGGRKTATEVRTAGEAGASRLAARARLVSAQGMVDLAEQMSLNIQQYLTMEFYLQVIGKVGLQAPVPITPGMVAGDFYYPVNDGTLPLDKTAILGVWKEIWTAIATNPLLSRQYDGGKIFEYIAELGGAKNIGQFKIQAMPDEQVGAGINDGSITPLGPGGGPPPGGGSAQSVAGVAPANAGIPGL